MSCQVTLLLHNVILLFLLHHFSIFFNLSFCDGFAGALCELLIMVLINSSFEYDSNGCHIVLLRENHVEVNFWLWNRVLLII